MHQEIKATVIWLLLAFFLTCAGFWQAKVAVANDARVQHRDLPPPAKTKLAIRPPTGIFTGDVVQDYIARCEKGMRDQEIGWILEDFHNAGLDLHWRTRADTVEQILHRRPPQYRWLHDALVDGLRLSPEQSAQVTKSFNEFLDKEVKWSREHQKSVPDSFGPIPLATDDLRSELAGLMTPFTSVPVSTFFSPWKLCQLTPEQERLTWKQWFSAVENRNPEILTENDDELANDPVIDLDTFDEGYPIDESLHLATWLPNQFFPLLEGQKLIAKNDPTDPFADPSDPPGRSTLENVRLLHPAQLKALLLFNPGFAPILQSQLAEESR